MLIELKSFIHVPRLQKLLTIIQSITKTLQNYGHYTISVLARYSRTTFGKYSFLENSVAIGKIYWFKNNIVSSLVSTNYCVNIEAFPKIALTQYSIPDTQISTLTNYSRMPNNILL